ncbi:uncharacterized protein, partial [Argopecten irradians]|uniref:uncharacterized protein n=1 Tax=Argopecten irradians TaxID=31199 RepID=UPI0037152518
MEGGMRPGYWAVLRNDTGCQTWVVGTCPVVFNVTVTGYGACDIGYGGVFYMVDNVCMDGRVTFRMSGFYLYVSNSSIYNTNIPIVMNNSHLCYHDHGPGLPSYIQSLSCHVSGRYVIFYNKRPADYEPQNVRYYNTTTAVIELCEVQVIGGCPPGRKGNSCNQACDPGTFGLDCNQTCHCATSDCNTQTGVCTPTGCIAGWKGTKCDEACNNYTFGRDCNQTCHCANSDCDRRTGVCNMTGCTEGWRGQTCSQACINQTYGRDCTQICHCANSDCDGSTGECYKVGCTEGWRGQTCSQACTNHTFGRDCNQTCHCANSDCDGRTGVCNMAGCTEGWKGQTCSQACINQTYGRDCTQICHCANSDCDGSTGECNKAGCTEGWRGQSCSQACTNQTFGRDNETCHCANSDSCTNHTYGRDCTQICHCANSDCDGRTGVCKVPGCTEGWRGQTCSQACTNQTFGRDCTQTCHCFNSDCDWMTGVCDVPGCMEGWRGQTCSQECQTGYVGPNCTDECHCQSPGCNHINGTCHNMGCKAGWSGQACDQRHETQTSDESSNGNSAQIGGIVGAVVAVLLVIVISFIVVRKRRARGSASSKYAAPNKSKATENVYINVGNVESTKDEISPEVKITETDVDEDEVIYVNGPNDTDVRGETKLLMSELKEIVTAKKENEMYEVEFKSLPHGLKYPYKASNLPKNIPLNRFKTTFPYDHSRVVLKKEKAGSTDYINANFIDGVRNEKAYIATQGPKTNTLEDFWRMIWQNKCGKIVMLANLMELGKIKCITYWAAKESDEEPLELNLFQVKLQEETAYAFYTIRTITVKNKQTNTTRRITQYHFTKWPDHGVPEPFELLQFYKRIKNGRTEHRGPLVVHC